MRKNHWWDEVYLLVVTGIMAMCAGYFVDLREADASDTIWLPNLSQQQTGSTVSGHYSSDVFVQGGNLAFTEQATAAPGSSAPSLDKVIGGLGADTKIHTLATDNSGNLQTGRTWTTSSGTDSMACVQSGAPWSVSGSGSFTVQQGTGSNLHTQVDSSALPSGAATSANQSTEIANLGNISAQLPANLGQKTMSNSLAVTIASDQTSVPAATGRTVVTTVRNAYGSTNVTTSAWVQLVASTSGQVNELDIFDSSGQTLQIGTGGAGSEVALFYVYPGGNGRIPVKIPASTRVAIKAVSATASSGELDINFLQ